MRSQRPYGEINIFNKSYTAGFCSFFFSKILNLFLVFFNKYVKNTNIIFIERPIWGTRKQNWNKMLHTFFPVWCNK